MLTAVGALTSKDKKQFTMECFKAARYSFTKELRNLIRNGCMPSSLNDTKKRFQGESYKYPHRRTGIIIMLIC
jgi:hypothetical protein